MLPSVAKADRSNPNRKGKTNQRENRIYRNPDRRQKRRLLSQGQVSLFSLAQVLMQAVHCQMPKSWCKNWKQI